MRINDSRSGLLACLLGFATVATADDVTTPSTGSDTAGDKMRYVDIPSAQFLQVQNILRAPMVTETTLTWSAVATGEAAPTYDLVNLVKNDGEVIVATGTFVTVSLPTDGGNVMRPSSTPTGAAVQKPTTTTASTSVGLPGFRQTERDMARAITGVEAMHEIRAEDLSSGKKFSLDATVDSSGVAGGLLLRFQNSSNPEELWNTDFTSSDIWEKVLYLKLDWHDRLGRVGSTYSPAFIVTRSSIISGNLLRALTESGKSLTSGAKEESDPKTATTTITPTTAVPSVTASPTSSAGALSGSAESSGGGGLSTGAMIGIGVGAGLGGIALIGLLVWFFIKRRRDQRGGAHYPVGYSSDGPAESNGRASKWDKEMPMVSSESPQSRYAPDGGRLHDQRSSMVAGAGHEDDSTTYAPYSDQAPSHGGAGATATRGVSSAGAATSSQTDLRENLTRSPTPPIATRYAHLVEEGMTEDEIRRLEEEERALDAAIEDAGRNSRAA